MEKITEQDSLYRHIENMSTLEVLEAMNHEDRKVADAVGREISSIQMLVDVIVDKMISGGRLFYIGAGTSGRLGIVDASECPPTFGVEHGLVIGIIAGGDSAIRKAVEFAEDNKTAGWDDLLAYHINQNDVVVGVAASGTTPYVVCALQECQKHHITTACITCNPGSPVTTVADFPIVPIVGPEFISGSTRLKSGTAQKLTLNMISTAVMVKLGRVKDNKMVNMQLTNDKLIERGTKMIADALSISVQEAREMLLKEGSVRRLLDRGRQ